MTPLLCTILLLFFMYHLWGLALVLHLCEMWNMFIFSVMNKCTTNVGFLLMTFKSWNLCYLAHIYSITEILMQNVSVHAGVLSTLLCLCLIFWERDLVDLNAWALSVTSIIAGFLVLILLSVSLQPTSSKPLSFKVYALHGTWSLLHHVTNENKFESWNFIELKPHNIMFFSCNKKIVL